MGSGEAAERVGLIPARVDLTGESQRVQVERSGLRWIASDRLQLGVMVERLNFGAAITKFAVDRQRLAQRSLGFEELALLCLYGAQEGEYMRLAKLAVEILVELQSGGEILYSGREFAGQPSM